MAKTVSLSRQYVIGSAVFDSLSFREPKLSHYRRLGRVAEMQRGAMITYPDAIWGYAEALLDTLPPGALDELDLTDAVAVEEAMLGFFTDANKALRERENSSSGSSGAPPTLMD